MKSRQEFEQFYQKILLPELKRLEAKRRFTLIKAFLWTAGFIAILLGLNYVFYYYRDFLNLDFTHYDSEPPFWILLVFINGLYIFLFFKSKIQPYKINYKKTVISKLIKFFHKELDYVPESFISLEDFQQSKLFLSDISNYTGEDHVSGKIDATQVSFSELEVSGSALFFKGLFLKADFNKHFQGETFIFPNAAQHKVYGSLNQILQKHNIYRPDTVNLEDPIFNKEFIVYSTDQVEARYILSPSLMKRILDLHQKLDQTLCLSFTGTNMYLAVLTDQNFFCVNTTSKSLDLNILQKYFEELALLVGIVEDLNLNTRIWSKR